LRNRRGWQVHRSSLGWRWRSRQRGYLLSDVLEPLGDLIERALLPINRCFEEVEARPHTRESTDDGQDNRHRQHKEDERHDFSSMSAKASTSGRSG
jgi:hypothetical protein